MNTENTPFDHIDPEIDLPGELSSSAFTYDDLAEMNHQISEATLYTASCNEEVKHILEPVIQMACDNFCDICELMQVDPVYSDFDSYESNVESLLNVLCVEEVWNRVKSKLLKALTNGDAKKEHIYIGTIERFTLKKIVGRTVYVNTNTDDENAVIYLGTKYKLIFESVIAELTRCRTDVIFV